MNKTVFKIGLVILLSGIMSAAQIPVVPGGGGGGSPTGAAGGALSGTYPNPVVVPPAISGIKNFVVEGDSLSAPGENGNISVGQEWSGQAISMSALVALAPTKTNFAVAGNTIAMVTARYAGSVHPLSPAVTGSPGMLSVWMGANDYKTGETAATIDAALSSYWANAKTDGWRVVVWTLIRRGDTDDGTGSFELIRQSVNAYIKQQYLAGAFDELVDAGNIVTNPYDGITMNPADFTHPTATGAYLLAKMFNAQMWHNGYVLPISATGNNQSFTCDYSNLHVATGTLNTACGYDALALMTTGSHNSAFGYNAGHANLIGVDDVYFGFQSGLNHTGSQSVILGSKSGNITTGGDNIAIGYQAIGGTTATAAAQNVSIGSTTMFSITTAVTGNVVIGFRAGQTIASNNNVLIGQQTVSASTGAANIAIGNTATIGGTATNAVQLGVGTNSTSNTMQFESFNFLTSAGVGTFTALIPGTLYSAAGTALPACATGLKGETAVVSDATTPTYMGGYVSGGGITVQVICSFNGTTFAWATD